MHYYIIPGLSVGGCWPARPRRAHSLPHSAHGAHLLQLLLHPLLRADAAAAATTAAGVCAGDIGWAGGAGGGGAAGGGGGGGDMVSFAQTICTVCNLAHTKSPFCFVYHRPILPGQQPPPLPVVKAFPTLVSLNCALHYCPQLGLCFVPYACKKGQGEAAKDTIMRGQLFLTLRHGR